MYINVGFTTSVQCKGRVVVAWLATVLVNKIEDGVHGPDDILVLMAKTT